MEGGDDGFLVETTGDFSPLVRFVRNLGLARRQVEFESDGFVETEIVGIVPEMGRPQAMAPNFTENRVY